MASVESYYKVSFTDLTTNDKHVTDQYTNYQDAQSKYEQLKLEPHKYGNLKILEFGDNAAASGKQHTYQSADKKSGTDDMNAAALADIFGVDDDKDASFAEHNKESMASKRVGVLESAHGFKSDPAALMNHFKQNKVPKVCQFGSIQVQRDKDLDKTDLKPAQWTEQMATAVEDSFKFLEKSKVKNPGEFNIVFMDNFKKDTGGNGVTIQDAKTIVMDSGLPRFKSTFTQQKMGSHEFVNGPQPAATLTHELIHMLLQNEQTLTLYSNYVRDEEKPTKYAETNTEEAFAESIQLLQNCEYNNCTDDYEKTYPKHYEFAMWITGKAENELLDSQLNVDRTSSIADDQEYDSEGAPIL